MDEKEKVKLIAAFVESGKGKILEKWYIKQGIICSYLLKGLGTASSELLDVLGLGSTEKDILISFVGGDTAKYVLGKLCNEMQEEKFGKGIVFDLSLTGLNSVIATLVLGNQNAGSGGTMMNQSKNNSLILIAVNQGHTDKVMETAREAGAQGGTIIRARWAGDQDMSYIYGISVQAEKEIIAIVASAEKRKAIMEMVNKVHGIKSEAGAIICSLGLDHVIRLA